MLQEIVGSIPVLLNLNGDDSAALGCVYYASGPKFTRTKLEKVWDIPYYPIYTTFYRPRSPYDSVGGSSEGRESHCFATRLHNKQPRENGSIAGFQRSGGL